MANDQSDIDNALKALLICRDRSRVALSCLKDNNIDDFYAAQKTFNIAFSNFQSLDHILQQRGQDLIQVKRAKDLLIEIEQDNQTATDLVEIILENTKNKLQKSGQASRVLSDYATVNQSANKFVKFT